MGTAGESRSLTFPHVAHATLEGLRRVSVGADAAVPKVLLDHLRLPLLSSHRRGFLVHNSLGRRFPFGAARGWMCSCIAEERFFSFTFLPLPPLGLLLCLFRCCVVVCCVAPTPTRKHTHTRTHARRWLSGG